MNKEEFYNVFNKFKSNYSGLIVYEFNDKFEDEVLERLNIVIDKIVKNKTIELETKIEIYNRLISNSNFKIVEEILKGE